MPSIRLGLRPSRAAPVVEQRKDHAFEIEALILHRCSFSRAEIVSGGRAASAGERWLKQTDGEMAEVAKLVRERMDEHLHPDREAKPKVGAMSAEQAESFAVLRRPQIEGDRRPESHGETLQGGLIGRAGLNPELARRAATQLGDVWVVPGNGFIALDVGGGDMVCSRTTIAARQGLVTWTSTAGAVQDLVHGLVPDGVREVSLFAANGASTTVVVDDNVYGTMLNGHLRSVRFVGPTGAVDLGPWG
jgi:hypothetical protein